MALQPENNHAAQQAQNGLSENEKQKMIETKAERTKIMKEESKFFSLELGERAEILVHLPAKKFDGKNRDGDLVTQYRYTVEDLRNPENIRAKQWDTYPTTAEKIDNAILRGNNKLIQVQCRKGKSGGKNYIPLTLNETEEPEEDSEN
jgi:hypothetical protein